MFSYTIIHHTHVEFLIFHSPSSAAFALRCMRQVLVTLFIVFCAACFDSDTIQRLSAAVTAHDALQREALQGGTSSHNLAAKAKRKTVAPK
jgi:hypothetical protein